MILHRLFLVVACLLAVSGTFYCAASCAPMLTASVSTSNTQTTTLTATTTSTPGTPPASITETPGKISMEKLVEKADYIIAGQVTNIAQNQQIEGSLYTVVTLSVEQKIKGEPGPEVTIKIPGGEIGGITMVATDYPNFHAGEKAVVFLVKDGGDFKVSGGYQGKLTIDENNMIGNTTLTDYTARIESIIANQ